MLVTTALALAGVATATVASSYPSQFSFIQSTSTQAPAATDPDISISQTATPTGVPILGDLTYTLTVTNTSATEDATAVNVLDTLPADVTNVDTTNAVCPRDGSTMYCEPFALAAGATRTIDIHITAPASPRVMTNSASVWLGGNQVDNNPDNDTTSLDTVVGDVDLGLTKLVGSTAPVAIGTEHTYTLRVGNAGPHSAYGGTVYDALPPQLAWVNKDDSCRRVIDSVNVIACTFGQVDPGKFVTLPITVRAVGAGPAIVNVATVRPSDNFDYNEANDTALSPALQIYTVDLRLTKTASVSGAVALGTTFTYTLHVTNGGPNSASGTIIDHLPPQLQYHGSDDTCSPVANSNDVRCNIGSIPAGGSRDFLIDVTAVGTGTAVTNTATVSPDPESIDFSSSDDQATSPALRIYDVNLGLSKTASVTGSAPIGTQFTYTLHVMNRGPAAANGGTVFDSLPSQVDFVSADNTCTRVVDTIRDVRCDLGTIPAGTPRDFRIRVVAARAGAAVVNSATLSPGEGNVDFGAEDDQASSAALRIYHVDAPANDNLRDAQVITGVKGRVTGTNLGATAENGEPAHADENVSHSIWYVFTPGRGSVTLDTFGSNFDTLLAVYTGPDVVHLTEVASNDDASGNFDTHQSRLTFTAQTGTTYRVAIDGFDASEVGNTVLNWGFEGAKLSPADAAHTVGESHTVTATLTKQDGDSVVGGTRVRFTVVAGPNVEETADVLTNSDGIARFTYSSAKPGTDQIEARFDAHDTTLISDRISVTWNAAKQAPATPPKADVGVSVSGPTSARVGESLTFKAFVANAGPDAATGVVLKTPVPSGATLDSVSSTSGNGCTRGTTATCFIGTLAPGTTVTVTMVFTATQQGPLTVSPSAQGDNDPNGGNNASSGTANVISPTAPPLPPPPSSAPGTFNAVGSGTITVNGTVHPADQLFQLNSGDVVDATNGAITFTSSDGSFLSVSASQFTARHTSSRASRAATSDVPAQFKVTQPATAGEITTLTLIGGDFTSCAKSRSLSAKDKRPVRRLWGSGKGRFRTQARFSAATVRGTVWLTEDRCDGSLTTVVQGVVDVFDKSLNKTVAVSPGQSYLALPKSSVFKPPAVAQGAATQSPTSIRQTGLVWAGRRFTTQAAFEQWLRARGKTWEQFKKNYPVQAAALAGRS